jgi:2-keto-3-deoxy-L-rhamnonate aldolase RhmA
MGVQGVQIPHISNVEAARAAVQAVRYPPLGDRGMAGASRATNYGKVPMMQHIEQSNREITLALMIEDQQALDQMDEIAKVEGVDLIVVGPADMSRTLGVTGTPNHPKLLAVIERLQKALANGAGAKLALPINHMGCAYANCAPAPEVRLMKSLQAQADEMRKQLG